jgi:hypothetical protein
VPGKHNEKTGLLGFYADLELKSKIEEERGGLPRSQFLRDATIDYMEKRGVKGLEKFRNAPDRAGKGGPTKYRLKQKSKRSKPKV